MSVLAVCGGEVPSNVSQGTLDYVAWAKRNRCLFTVVDDHDNPKVVFEFVAGFDNTIDLEDLDKHRHLEQLLSAAGISFFVITPAEFSRILDPDSELDFVSFLEIKARAVGLIDAH